MLYSHHVESYFLEGKRNRRTSTSTRLNVKWLGSVLARSFIAVALTSTASATLAPTAAPSAHGASP
jgi:hypothetical protein